MSPFESEDCMWSVHMVLICTVNPTALKYDELKLAISCVAFGKIVVAQNHPLWRQMYTFGAMHC